MENRITLDNKYISNDNIYETLVKNQRQYRKSELNEITYGLSVEDAKNFFSYLKKFKLTNDPDLLILPPNSHYYFDEKELKSVRTLINLKNLNLIKELDSFLYTLIRLLPPDANFLGYFSYNRIKLTGDGFFSGLTTRLNNILDFRTDHNMDEKELSDYLQKFGFRIYDMTEMNGLIFFYSRNVRNNIRLSA